MLRRERRRGRRHRHHAEIARSLGKKDIVSVKALQIAGSNGVEEQHNTWDGSYFATARVAAQRAYREAGIERPREQLSLVECHDCFSVTELVTLEELFISPEGGAVKDVLDGFLRFGRQGSVPNRWRPEMLRPPDRRVGIRMIYEMYLQLQGRAGARQRPDVRLGLTHNLGGFPARKSVPSPSSAPSAPDRRLLMKAMICRQWGGPEDLRLEEIQPVPLKTGQVRIRVRAAGVSFATTLVIAGKYQRRPPFPSRPVPKRQAS